MAKRTQSPSSVALVLGVRAKAAGLTQTELANRLDVSQGRISRIFSGQVSRDSKLLRDMQRMIDVELAGVTAAQVRGNSELIEALVAVWDGTPEQSRALVGILRSLGPLTSQRQSRGGEK